MHTKQVLTHKLQIITEIAFHLMVWTDEEMDFVTGLAKARCAKVVWYDPEKKSK